MCVTPSADGDVVASGIRSPVLKLDEVVPPARPDLFTDPTRPMARPFVPARPLPEIGANRLLLPQVDRGDGDEGCQPSGRIRVRHATPEAVQEALRPSAGLFWIPSLPSRHSYRTPSLPIAGVGWLTQAPVTMARPARASGLTGIAHPPTASLKQLAADVVPGVSKRLAPAPVAVAPGLREDRQFVGGKERVGVRIAGDPVRCLPTDCGLRPARGFRCFPLAGRPRLYAHGATLRNPKMWELRSGFVTTDSLKVCRGCLQGRRVVVKAPKSTVARAAE